MTNAHVFKAWAGLLAMALIMVLPSVKAQTMRPQPVASQPAINATPAPPTQLNMPLVGLDDGRRFQENRTVAPSSVPLRPALPNVNPTQARPSLTAVSGAVLVSPLARPTLGHALPATRTTPLGFARADFAIDQGKTVIKASGANQSPSSAVSNAVIQ